jgi:chaperonin cofactor prefoldin
MEQALELPNNVESLQQMLRTLTRDHRQLQFKYDSLQEQIRLLLHKRFGANRKFSE